MFYKGVRVAYYLGFTNYPLQLVERFWEQCRAVWRLVKKSMRTGFSLLKAWALVMTVVLIFGSVAAVFYGLFYLLVMPINYQESQVAIYKENGAIVGNCYSELALQNEEYWVNVVVQVPEDEENYKIGNFEVQLAFNYQNLPDIRMKNSGILKYYSPISRWIRSIAKTPLIILGFLEEKQDVEVRFYHSFQNINDFSEIQIKVTPENLRVYSISINFEVKLRGIRYYMFYHWVISFFVGTGIIFAIMFMSFVLLIAVNLGRIVEFLDLPQLGSVPLQSAHTKPKALPETVDFSLLLKPVPKSRWSFF
jgi:hypothetical protein